MFKYLRIISFYYNNNEKYVFYFLIGFNVFLYLYLFQNIKFTYPKIVE